MPKVGIRMVAEEAGVSIGTVSKIMNPNSANNINVSAATRRKVQEAATKLNYQASYGAKLLRGESSQTIGFAMSLPGDHSYAYLSRYILRLLNGVGRAASEQGYQILLLNGIDYRRFLDVKRLDALIINGFAPVNNPRQQEMDELFAHFMRHDYPFAVIGGHGAESSIPCFYADNAGGMQQIVELLQRKGITDVGFVGELTLNPQYDHQQRLEELRRRLALHNIALNERGSVFRAGGDVPEIPRVGAYARMDGQTAMDILYRRGTVPRCIVCGSDAIAAAVLKRALELGIKVPEQLGIIGFDDDPDVDMFNPGLTTVHQMLEEAGELAVEYVLEKIRNPKTSVVNMQLKTTLKERGTV